MRIQGSLGMVLLAGGLTLVAACGNDNELLGTPTPTKVPPATNTSGVPTSTGTPSGPTNTPVPSTPTNTPGGATPTPTSTVMGGAAVCGDGQVTLPEECDCGAVCLLGDSTMIGQSCSTDGQCGPGGYCAPVGGQLPGGGPGSCPSGQPACAANCTLETYIPGVFKNTCATGVCSEATTKVCASDSDCTSGQGTCVGLGDSCNPAAPNQCRQASCAATLCGCQGGTVSRTQLSILPLFLPIQGTQNYRAGKVRDDTVIGPSGKVLYTPGQVPLATRFDDFHFEPIALVPVNTCACVRAFVQSEFGPNLAGVGVVNCHDDGPTPIDYHQTVNHNMGVISQEQCLQLPHQGTLRTSGVEVGGPPGPLVGTCTSQTATPGTCETSSDGGTTWFPDEPCGVFPGAASANALCNDPHPTICNYLEDPAKFEMRDCQDCNLPDCNMADCILKDSPKGSAVIRTFTAVSTIAGNGTCAANSMTNGTCTPNPMPFNNPVNGPDGCPCTPDDLRQVDPMIFFNVTGTGGASVANANPAQGSTTPSGINISIGSLDACTGDATCASVHRGERCYNVNNPAVLCSTNSNPSCVCRTSCGTTACITEGTGHLFDCDAFKNDPLSAIGTGQTIVSFGSLHTASGLDLVATTNFQVVPPTPTTP